MSATNTSANPTLRAIGDLDSPLWGDERSRTIWLESIAVAHQAYVFLGYLLAVAMVWVGGRALSWWSFAVIALVAIGNLLSTRYAAANGLTFPSGRKLLTPRALALAALTLAWVVGYLRARVVETPDAATGWGLVTGLGVGLVVGLVLIRRAKRTTDLPDDDVFDA